MNLQNNVGLQIANAIGDVSTAVDVSELMKDSTGQDIVDGLTALASAVKPDASNIPYSNTSSGLTATNVQGAIDEVVDKSNITVTTESGYTININQSYLIDSISLAIISTILRGPMPSTRTKVATLTLKPKYTVPLLVVVTSATSNSYLTTGFINTDGEIMIMCSTATTSNQTFSITGTFRNI